jgi:hypothetical protein
MFDLESQFSFEDVEKLARVDVGVTGFAGAGRHQFFDDAEFGSLDEVPTVAVGSLWASPPVVFGGFCADDLCRHAVYLKQKVVSGCELTTDEGLLGWWGCRVGRAEDEHVGGIGAEGDAFFFEGENDAAAKFAEDAVALVDAHADLDGVGHGAAIDLVDSGHDGVGDSDVFEDGVVANIGCDPGEQGDDLVGIGAGVDTDVEVGNGIVAGEIGDGGDLAVGDDVEGAVGVADAGAAEGEVFDRTLEAGEIYDLADVVLVFDEDEDAVDHVLEDALGTEADGDAENAGGGEDRLVGDAQDIEDLEEDEEAEDGVGGGSYDGGHGAELGGAMEVGYLMIGEAMQAFDEEQYQAVEYEDDEENCENSWELVLNDGDEVVFPGMLNGLDGADRLILRGHGQKVHDYDVSLSGCCKTECVSYL